MDLVNVRSKLFQKQRELNEIRANEMYGYMKVGKKLEKIENLIILINRRLKKDRERDFSNVMRRQIGIAFRKWKENKMFMSLDIERTINNELHEIGITLIRGKTIESFNYRLRGIQRNPQFVFGKTIEAPESVVRNLIRIHAQSADFYIGHNFKADMKHLNAEYIEIPNKFTYDTADWSKALFGHYMKLGDMARKFNVGAAQFHCAGNDARYTAEIFLKIINEFQ